MFYNTTKTTINTKPTQAQPIYKPSSSELLQVPVIVGWGSNQNLVVEDLTIAPPSPPVFRIKDIDKVVTITNMKLVPITTDECSKDYEKLAAKVIIDGYVDKNINYKTISEFTSTSVNGPVYQFTTQVPFATVVDVKSKDTIKESDNVEILDAFVEGENDELTSPNAVPSGAPSFAVTYNTIVEKMIVFIKLKVTRTKHVAVNTSNYK